MQLVLVFAFLALFCLAQTAPASTTSRVLIFPQYDDPRDDIYDSGFNTSDDDDDDNENDLDKTTITTMTTTARTTTKGFRFSTFIFSGRRTPQTSSIKSITPEIVFEDDEADLEDEYGGDFKYIKDLQKYLSRLLEKTKKLIRNVLNRVYPDSASRTENFYDD